MFNVLMPVGLFVYGVYMLVSNGIVGNDYTFWIKIVASIGGGLYLLVSSNIDKIKSISLPSIKKGPTIGISSHKVSVKGLLPTDLELKDNECLVHLRNRLLLAKSEEGLETLAKLDSIMFKLPKVDGE